jgi:hypothetical protein
MILTPDEMRELEITLGLTKPQAYPVSYPQAQPVSYQPVPEQVSYPVAQPEPYQLANHRLKQGRFSDDELAQIAAALGV